MLKAFSYPRILFLLRTNSKNTRVWSLLFYLVLCSLLLPPTSQDRKMNLRLNLTITAHFLLLASSQSEPSPVPCIPLSAFIEPGSQDNLDIFIGGGEVPGDVPVFFDIPRTEISASSPQVKLCIEDVPIPTSVGGRECDGVDTCWLVIGRHTGANPTSEDVRYCKSSDPYRGTTPCYACTCSGATFGSGSVPDDRTLSYGCGLSAQNSWGTSCPDVYNGRLNLTHPYDGTNPSYSNYSTVQINICGGIEDNCNVCRGGGYQPGFRVGLQWANNAEQCFADSPFSGGYAFDATRVLGFAVAAAGLLLSLSNW